MLRRVPIYREYYKISFKHMKMDLVPLWVFLWILTFFFPIVFYKKTFHENLWHKRHKSKTIVLRSNQNTSVVNVRQKNTYPKQLTCLKWFQISNSRDFLILYTESTRKVQYIISLSLYLLFLWSFLFSFFFPPFRLRCRDWINNIFE